MTEPTCLHPATTGGQGRPPLGQHGHSPGPSTSVSAALNNAVLPIPDPPSTTADGPGQEGLEPRRLAFTIRAMAGRHLLLPVATTGLVDPGQTQAGPLIRLHSQFNSPAAPQPAPHLVYQPPPTHAGSGSRAGRSRLRPSERVAWPRLAAAR